MTDTQTIHDDDDELKRRWSEAGRIFAELQIEAPCFRALVDWRLAYAPVAILVQADGTAELLRPDPPPALLATLRDEQRTLLRVACERVGLPEPLILHAIAALQNAAEKEHATCTVCGRPVEPARTCYARPVCYRCLPPPEPLPVA